MIKCYACGRHFQQFRHFPASFSQLDQLKQLFNMIYFSNTSNVTSVLIKIAHENLVFYLVYYHIALLWMVYLRNGPSRCSKFAM